jgi:HlyD family secretion protein
VTAGLVAAALFGVWKLLVRDEALPVQARPAERGVVEEIVTNSRAGSIRARYRSQIGAETAGRVAALPHREGAQVDSGAVLARLADDVARAGRSLARRDLESTAAALLAAEAKAELAASELARAEGLQQRGAVTEETLETARSRDKSARAELDAARAQVERARAALQLADAELERHTVRAPFAGVVNQLFVEVGASVVPGQALLELMSREQPYVSAPMDELDIARIRVGQKARVRLDPYPERAFAATVTRVAPFVSEFQEQNRTMEIELGLEDLDGGVDLRPGTSADVEIVIARRDNTLRIPALALLEGERVLVVESGRAAERRVRVGLRNWDYVEILEGLAEGDVVITSLEKGDLKPGTAVTVSREPPA